MYICCVANSVSSTACVLIDVEIIVASMMPCCVRYVVLYTGFVVERLKYDYQRLTPRLNYNLLDYNRFDVATFHKQSRRFAYRPVIDFNSFPGLNSCEYGLRWTSITVQECWEWK